MRLSAALRTGVHSVVTGGGAVGLATSGMHQCLKSDRKQALEAGWSLVRPDCLKEALCGSIGPTTICITGYSRLLYMRTFHKRAGTLQTLHRTVRTASGGTAFPPCARPVRCRAALCRKSKTHTAPSSPPDSTVWPSACSAQHSTGATCPARRLCAPCDILLVPQPSTGCSDTATLPWSTVGRWHMTCALSWGRMPSGGPDSHACRSQRYTHAC
jgi:hypothetical protein